MTKNKGLIKRFRHLSEYIVFLVFSSIIRFLSAETVFQLGQSIGRIAFMGGGKRKKIAMINLDIAFGDTKSAQEKQRIVKQSFIQLAVSSLQCIWMFKDPQTRVHELITEKPEGVDILNQCLDRGKGVFFLTAHYGNWEAMGILHGYLGVSQLNSIVRRLDNPLLDKVVLNFRTISGNDIFYRDESPMKIVRALKNNQCVAVMMDQNTAKGGLFVNFFGIKAATARSLAMLSYRTGAAILPLFSYPIGHGKYRIEYGPELKLNKTGDKAADIQDWTQKCEDFLESVIRTQHEPWMWGHRRWKTRPSDEQGKKIY